MTLLSSRAWRGKVSLNRLTAVKRGHHVSPEGTGLGRIQIAAEEAGANESRDTLYAIGGQFFQQNFLAFWRSVDGGETWEARITDSRAQLAGYTVNGADNGGQAFGICASKWIRRTPAACWSAASTFEAWTGAPHGIVPFIGRVPWKPNMRMQTSMTLCLAPQEGDSRQRWWCVCLGRRRGRRPVSWFGHHPGIPSPCFEPSCPRTNDRRNTRQWHQSAEARCRSEDFGWRRF